MSFISTFALHKYSAPRFTDEHRVDILVHARQEHTDRSRSAFIFIVWWVNVKKFAEFSYESIANRNPPMNTVFPTNPGPTLSTVAKPISAKTLASIDQLIVLLPPRCPTALWRKLPDGERLRKLMGRRGAGSVPAAHAQIRNARQTGILVSRLAGDPTTFNASEVARKLAVAALHERPRSVAVAALGFDPVTTDRYASLLAEAVLINAFALPRYGKPSRDRPVKSVRVFNVGTNFDLGRVRTSAAANNLARWLGLMPPNFLDAVSYRSACEKLAKTHGWTSKFYSEAALKKLGAGAFLAVAQGNDASGAGILHLRYEPDKKHHLANVSLVGKGIIFDTGGNNLKPFKSMLDMHTDMLGSAVALASLQALSELRAPFAVDCWLAITENRIGPHAYKSQDVITALNGKTIQAIHTDAEGRMVLADTLTLASRAKPDVVIDFATLTGSCVTAITSRYSGVFTNRPELHPLLKRAGEASGERVWPFPVTPEFLQPLKSDVADLKQCSEDGSGDHILAACFLNEFVPEDIPWIHVDLSACAHKGGLGIVNSEITGFGVRYTLALLLEAEDSLLAHIR